MSTTLQIDDRDPNIVYISAPNTTVSSWNQEGNLLEFNNTVTWTDTALAIVWIPFDGTGISVWGTVNNAPNPTPQTMYQIDDGPFQFINETVLPQMRYQQKFFDSGMLDPGFHNLFITNLVDGSNFRLDFVQVNGAPTLTAASSSPTTQTVVTVVINGSAAPSNAGTRATSSPVPVSANKGEVHVAPIVGGILGGVIVILVFLFIFFIRKRRNAEKRKARLSSWTPLENVIREDAKALEIPAPYLPPYDAGNDKLKDFPQTDKKSAYLPDYGTQDYPTGHNFDAKSVEHSPPQYDA